MTANKGNLRKNISYYFTEYCENSTIHGLKFLGERRRSVVEKIWWLVFVSLSLYFCGNMIRSTYKKWLNSPVLVSFATSETPIWEIPFPAVTICPLMKTDLGKFNFKSVSPTNYSQEEATNLTYLSLLCPMVLELFSELNDTVVDDGSINFLLDLVPNFEESVMDCSYNEGDCEHSTSNIFMPVLTSGAVCYSFNMMDWTNIFRNDTDLKYYEQLNINHAPSSDWNTENGYADFSQTYPRRTSTIGTNGGFQIILKSIIKDASYNCGDTLKGFKVMIHNPSEIARFHQHYFWLPLDQLVSVAIKPNMITTYADLKSYKPRDRLCYFQDEVYLRYFKIYNQRNCMLECLTNYTLAKCKCVSFYMPRTSDIPICGPERMECAELANSDFNQMKSSRRKGVDSREVLIQNDHCNCMPSCFSLRYDLETSQLDWDWQNLNLVNPDDFVDNPNETLHFSRLRVFFKDLQFMTSERNELYGQTEFWANCGGLVGLFTGFSFISFIEILYYCTLRTDIMTNQITDSSSKTKPYKKYPGCGRNFYDYFSEYSSNSSIHGIKYIGEKKRSLVEKLCWMIVIFASLYICIYMIIKTYEKWQMSPVIVSFARSPTPVWEIPFPSVTVCSETKTRQSVFNFTDIYQKSLANNATQDELSMLERISLVCDSHLHPEGNETIDYDTIDFLAQVSPPFEEVFYECKWMNQVKNCKDLFTPTLSEEGICFTFNMLDRDELFANVAFQNREYLHHGLKSTNWSLENGYPDEVGKDAYPIRAISAGQGAGLSIGPVQGFKLLLHHPAEVPRVSQQYFRAPLNQEVVVAIKPDMMTTSDGLKGYHPHRRQCYFPSERQLQFYKVYTQQNCEVECLANYTLNRCGCVSYHMPHERSTKLCGPSKTMCVHYASVSLLTDEVEKNFDTTKAGHQECDCLPACTSLTYNSENSQADFNWPKVFEASKTNFKGVTLFFKEMQFITSERNELYGPTDFLANCGGLLGLFMGFSFLSIIEIVYFLSLRLICNLKNYGHHYWSGSSELLENKKYEH
ncbi:hypothetical protein FQR65_LT01711 [Abscondita terminalis]|nr:hypothetical protein FQR65_LT01711 [Abscondita terminalis]